MCPHGHDEIMIRGVSKYTVEISQTGSPYFERAICFVRPEFAQCGRVDLHRAARAMLGALDNLVEDHQTPDEEDTSNEPQERLLRLSAARWVIPTLSALGGAGAALLTALAIR